MSPTRPVAVAQLAMGWLLTRHPSRGLQLLGYPDDRRAARATLRVLGLRELLQGAAELRGSRATMWVGAGIDVVHALTCVVYARRSATGRRAGIRSALLAGSFAAAQAAAAYRAGIERTPAPPVRSPQHDPGLDMPWVASATAGAWPQPSENDQQVRVGGAQQQLVYLAGGVMDGAEVAVDPGTDHYDIVDSDRGPQRYTATDRTSDTGRRVFALLEEPSS